MDDNPSDVKPLLTIPDSGFSGGYGWQELQSDNIGSIVVAGPIASNDSSHSQLIPPSLFRPNNSQRVLPSGKDVTCLSLPREHGELNFQSENSFPQDHGLGGQDTGDLGVQLRSRVITGRSSHPISRPSRVTPGSPAYRRKKQLATLVCPISGCGFARSFNLQGHIHSHRGDNLSRCYPSKCEQGECKHHEQLHIKKCKRYACKACGKLFKRNGALEAHLYSGTICPSDHPNNISSSGIGDLDMANAIRASVKPVLGLQEIHTFNTSSPTQMEPILDNAGSNTQSSGESFLSALIRTRKRPEDPDEVRTLVTRLTVILGDIGKYRQLLACRDSYAQHLLDLFQSLLDTPILDVPFRRSLIVATQRLARRAGRYPSCYSLRGIEIVGDHPIAAGSFADIYRGVFQGHVVCMKVIRTYQTTQVDDVLKHFSKEIILWGQLSHPNLLPIYGLHRFQSRACLVSPWLENGDINNYLNQKTTVDRVILAADIAEGLSYLHKNGIIHGDLKGANILITRSGRACLADFGLSSVSDPTILTWASHSSAASIGGSPRWQAPELFSPANDEVAHNDKASDMYAWGCVCYEIFTGEVPFAQLIRDAAVIYQIMSGNTPSRPSQLSPSWSAWGLTEYIWSLMEECWKRDPVKRPTVDGVLARLVPILPTDERPPANSDFFSPAHFRLQASAT